MSVSVVCLVSVYLLVLHRCIELLKLCLNNFVLSVILDLFLFLLFPLILGVSCQKHNMTEIEAERVNNVI